MEEAPIRIGISSCLLGQEVRFDAGHKRDRYVTDTLTDYFEWVLQHMLGYFKKQLDGASRHELLAHIEDYRRGLVPLVVPLTLIRHYVRVLDVEYLRDQVYLNPHPKELRLRNHV